MDPTAQRAKEIFLELSGQVSAEESQHRLDEMCANDSALRQRVQALLRAHADPKSYLDQPAIDLTIDQPPLERPGTRIGPYKLLQQIGEGGMGVVYLAEQTLPVQRRVALKLIKAGMDSGQVIARFEAERQALAIMDHPNIARVLDAGTTESGRPYFVMELVNGIPVTQFCDEQHLTTRERLELFVPICQAVQHAHQKGIIHRDIKPSNILVALYDGRPVPKVIDFGVAKATSSRLTEKTMFTGLGQMVGTLEYMSPEQAQRNQLDIDTRSDVYSLGVVLYELLTGDTPFDKRRLQSAALDELLRIIREEEPPKPSTKLSSSDTLPSVAANRKIEPANLSALVRGELDWIVMKALEKDRNRRYETATGFADDVLRYLNDEPVQACPPSAWYQLQKMALRNRVALTISGLVLLFLILLGSGVGWAVRDRAAREAELAGERTERQAKIAGQVQLNLDEVERLSQEQKWPEALAVAKRAAAALAGDEADPATRERVRQALADLEMVARLEEIRLSSSELGEDSISFDYAGTVRRYAAAFSEYGVDVRALPADQAAARLRSHAAVVVPLAAALDDWGQNCRKARDDPLAKELWARAGTIDPDRWRLRVRQAVAARDVAGLVALAESPDTAQQPPPSQLLLAVGLRSGGRLAEAIALLERASEAHPADFWIHLELAFLNGSVRPKRLEAAVRHCTVARALRPRSSYIWNNLGVALYDQKKVVEAIACYRQAIELDPKFAAAHSNLGNALYGQGKLDEAVASHKKAIKLDPNLAVAHSNLGNALRDQKKLDEAIACYRQAIELDPNLALAHDNLGVALRDQEKLDEAIASHTKAIELDPKYAISHSNLGVALYDQKKVDEAIACYRQAIELDPKFASAHSNLGNALRDQKKLDEAIACCRQAIELDPKFALAHLNLGNALFDQGKVDEAIATYRKAIELDPKFALAHDNLGNALYGQGKLDEAIASHKKAIKLDPKLALAHSNLGNALRDQKKLDEAIACYRQAIELDPKFALAHLNLGNALFDQGKVDEAIATYRKAIELDPKFALAHYNLGVSLDDKGDLEGAIACFRKAIELDPKLASSHHNLGNALRRKRELDKAIACFRKAIELDPTLALAHYNLGVSLDDKGDLEGAIACYRKAIELGPTYAPAHDNLGVSLTDKGDLEGAIACFRKAIELDPKFASPHHNLGNALGRKRELDKAIACFRKAIELDPKLVNAHDGLGTALIEKGEFDEAIAWCRKAIEIDPKLANAHNSLGWALWKKGELDKAIACIRKAIELDPKLPRAHGNLVGLLMEKGELDEAIAWCRKAIELDQKPAHFHSDLGHALQRKGQWQEAIAACEEAVRLEPEFVQFHINLARVLTTCSDLKRRDPPRALAAAKKAVELAPQSTAAWQELGWAQYRAGDWTASIQALEKSCQLQGGAGDSGQWIVLALAHWKLAGQKELPEDERGRHKAEARRWYDQAAKQTEHWREPKDPTMQGILFFRAEADELLKIED